ncbi:MAG: thiamine pyrophosphate-dependent enzyme [Candidatus Shikimatogenerans bostrichidophilus]|nr:MAG: thiamine pyrophosphate-dependent enzyme [Candidatus Shikimatogenerans bostrichidophilus]
MNNNNYIIYNKIKWCLGCGNYSIINQLSKILNILKIKKKYIVIVSGIGCSSRLPYYINLKGVHTIHGRAFSIATGIKLSNNKFNVWVITGDGDSFSIGLKHLLHTIRRNININILIFNNGIYALTKGQKSYTYNNNNSFNIISLMLSSGATYVARTLYNNPINLRKILLSANKHIGTSCIEIIQNCPIYNNIKDKIKNILYLKNNSYLIYNNKCIILKKNKPIIKIFNTNLNNIWTHNIYNLYKSFILSNFNKINNRLPIPIGIIYKKKIAKNKKYIKKKYINDIKKLFNKNIIF